MASTRRLVITTPQGPEGTRLALDNAGQPPYNVDVRYLDGGDIEYPPPGGGLLRVPVGGGAAAQMFGTLDGQLVYWDVSAGEWVPTLTAPADTQIPTWDAASGRWVFINRPTLGSIEYFDATHSPVGLWNFNGTLNPVPGFGYNLTAAAGPVAYADITPGKRGLYVMVGNRFENATGNASNVALLGDMTMLAILQRDGTTGLQTIATHAGNGLGVASGQNTNWAFRMDQATSTAARTVSWLSESAVGVDATFTSGGDASLPPIHNVSFIAARRLGNVIRFYLNGLPFGPDSGILVAPTGGQDATTRFIVGAENRGSLALSQFVLMSLKVVSEALTDDQIKAEYNRTMGPAFGVLP